MIDNCDPVVIALCVLLFAATIPPFFQGVDIVQTNFGDLTVQDYRGLPVTQIRFSIWKACSCDPQDHWTCPPTNVYNVTLTGNENEAIIQASWTRGLLFYFGSAFFTWGVCAAVGYFAVHKQPSKKDEPSKDDPVPLGVLFAIFLATALITFTSIVIDSALFAHVKYEMAKLGGVETQPGPGFWLTLACFGCTIFFLMLEVWIFRIRNKSWPKLRQLLPQIR